VPSWSGSLARISTSRHRLQQAGSGDHRNLAGVGCGPDAVGDPNDLAQRIEARERIQQRLGLFACPAP
jgi:hypothetical protein